MTCPECKSNQLVVVDSRAKSDGIRRRRKCLDCGARFPTFEAILDKYRKDKGRSKK